MIRVALVDDQQLIRAGFRMVVDSQADLTVVAEAGSGTEAVDILTSLEPPADVVLMDVRMPDGDGLTACAALTTAVTSRVIILTTFDLDEYMLDAIKAGASGFLLKDSPPEHLLDAIRTVYAGDAVIAPSATRRLIERVAHTLPPRPPGQGANASLTTAPSSRAYMEGFTEREREVLSLVARGYSNAEIGAQLYMAEPTVKTHVGRILSKLGARDRVQAVIIAYESGMVLPGS